MARQRKGMLELLEDDLDDPFKFALLVCRKMIEAGFHGVDPNEEFGMRQPRPE
jgi:hypothetical protein